MSPFEITGLISGQNWGFSMDRSCSQSKCWYFQMFLPYWWLQYWSVQLWALRGQVMDCSPIQPTHQVGRTSGEVHMLGSLFRSPYIGFSTSVQKVGAWGCGTEEGWP